MNCEVCGMQLYFAPLEGIGGYVFRNVQAECFDRADKYFAPFVVANQTHSFKTKEKKDLHPDNNRLVHLVPQILANHTEHCLWAIQEIASYGYDEINLNLGCPSKTVVTKGRGAGMLKDTDGLQRFLEEIYTGCGDVKISLKTRIGMESEEEFAPLMAIFNQYPVSELILHARLQNDYYKNSPHMEMYEYARSEAKMPLVYNGDLFTAEDYKCFVEKYPDTPGVMMGRGVMRNPALFREARGGEKVTQKEFYQFHQSLMEAYKEHLFDDHTVLFKLKENWFYMMQMFSGAEKYVKKIQKAKRLSEYTPVVKELIFSDCWMHEMKRG